MKSSPTEKRWSILAYFSHHDAISSVYGIPTELLAEVIARDLRATNLFARIELVATWRVSQKGRWIRNVRYIP